MDEPERVETGTRPDQASAMLQLGARVLRQLSVQAEAARAEARRAELQLLLEQAQAGEAGPLRQWLLLNGHVLAADPAEALQPPLPTWLQAPHGQIAAQPESFAVAPPPAGAPDHVDSRECQDWQALRVIARQRLADRLQELESPARTVDGVDTGTGRRPPEPESPQAAPNAGPAAESASGTSPPQREEPFEDSSEASTDRSTPIGKLTSTADTPAAAQAATKTAARTSDKPRSKARPTAGSASVATQRSGRILRRRDAPVGTQSPAEQLGWLEQLKTAQVTIDDSTAKAQRRSRLRGMVVSAVAHVLLIVGLAVVTIQVPIDGGILALEASASTETELDSLELTPESPVDTPAESLEAALPAYQPDFSTALPSQGDTGAQLLEQLPAGPPASQSLSQALTASAGNVPQNLGASFYGANATGSCFCFLIDGSATMRGAPWEAARAELIRTLNTLSEKQRFYIIFYHRDVIRIPQPGESRPARAALYATPENLQHALRWLQTLTIENSIPGGNQTNVLQAALELEPDGVFYLTDGDMTPGVQQAVLGTLRRLNRVDDLIDGEVVRIPIHTIAYHSEEGRAVMQRIAEENRGQFAYVPNPNPNPRRR